MLQIMFRKIIYSHYSLMTVQIVVILARTCKLLSLYMNSITEKTQPDRFPHSLPQIIFFNDYKEP